MPSENKTPNIGLNQWEGNEYVKRQDFVDDNALIDAAIQATREEIHSVASYAVASGTNAYTATVEGISALAEGMSIKIKFTNANTGASTLNINALGAKSILKGNGNALSSGNIKAGQICNLVYNGLNFQLLGEGGEYGTASPSDVLEGKTIGTEEGITEGTMPDKGPVVSETINLTEQNAEYTIACGFHSGLRKIKAVIAGLAANVIKAGVTVGGIAGNFTADATATAAQMLASVTAYVNGVKITGTIPSKADQTYTPSTINQTIAANQYLSGIQIIQGSPNFLEENIKDGVNMWGKIGKLVENFTASDFVGRGQSFNDTQLNQPIMLGAYFNSATIQNISSMLFCFRTIQTDSARQITVTIPTGADVWLHNPVTDVYSKVSGTFILPSVRFAIYIFFNPNRVTINATSGYAFTGGNFII
ncbi:hypothetical protein [Sedimentibacter sp.]|uniref:hypothetical protein n=1 Tax=Sedimentibacter sp. TaxID=1960295 RepID=UPI0028AAE624|nr:hypothetical protein [Sedimentibacter sp.]